MPEKHDGSDLLSDSDLAIFQYLDEMLSDPAEGAGSGASNEKPSETEFKPPPARKSNVLNSATLSPAPQLAPEPERKLPKARPLLLEERPQAKIISNPETLLRLQQPIVVQQPEVAEKPVDKPVEKPPQPQPPAEPEIALKPQPQKASMPAPAVPPSAEPPPTTARPVIARPVIAPVSIAPPEEPLVPDTAAVALRDTGTVPVEPAVPPAQAVTPQTAEVVREQPGDDRLPPMQPWCDNGRPDWAQGRFECLLFEVAGLKLAVPLVTLGAVHQIDRKFTSLPGAYDWFIGILQTNLGNIKVIDTSLCVMPERYDRSNRETLEFVITLHGFTWGISCHKLLKSITLEPEDVKWRTQRGKRPWMAGTVVEQMCALIDPAGFHHVILQAERRER